jgi:hypothetical protein
MATRIQVRRDLKANWSSSLVLASGEVAYETDTGNVKIGDNATQWSSLDYIAIASISTAQTDLNNGDYRQQGRFYLNTPSGSWTNLPSDMTAGDGESVLLVTRHMESSTAWFLQQLTQFVSIGSATKSWVRVYDSGASSYSAWQSTAHISPNEVVTASINNLAVTTGKIDDLAVTTAKIADLNVTTGKVADNAVTDAKIRDSAALSVIGRSANSTGDPADIAASSDGEVLRRSGTALGFGTLAAAAFADNTISPARLTNAAGATVLGATGAGAISQLSAVDGRSAIDAMIVPDNTSRASGAASSNPGDYCVIATAVAASFTLPVGGTWFVIVFRRINSNGNFDAAGSLFGPYAGGTVLSGASDRVLLGGAWRMV